MWTARLSCGKTGPFDGPVFVENSAQKEDGEEDEEEAGLRLPADGRDESAERGKTPGDQNADDRGDPRLVHTADRERRHPAQNGNGTDLDEADEAPIGLLVGLSSIAGL